MPKRSAGMLSHTMDRSANMAAPGFARSWPWHPRRRILVMARVKTGRTTHRMKPVEIQMRRRSGDVGGLRADTTPFDWRSFLPILIVLAGIAAYHSSFSGVFVLDDEAHIANNPRIRTVLPLSETLSGHRPVVDLSLAINYQFGGLNTWGYHVFNLAVHIVAGLSLLGVVRRTILRGSGADHHGRAAPWLALVIALIWVVHPLQTQSVTYVIQRGESLMGMFYLLTLYGVIRVFEEDARERGSRGAFWCITAMVACTLGMGSKGVMVSAPIIIWVYDWVFVSKSLGEMFRRRWWLHIGIAAPWAILFDCGLAPGVLNASSRNATVGFGFHGISPLEYLVTQSGVVACYLRLSLWPNELCLDYAWPVARTVREVLLPAIIILPLLLGTVWAVVRRSWIGFAGAWFFLILAPTTSIIPIKDPMFEHRMYLPLAAVVVVIVIGGFGVRARLLGTSLASAKVWLQRTSVAVCAGVIVLGTYGTVRRNRDYHDDLVMWQDVLAKRPENPRGHLGLGTSLFNRDDPEGAEQAFRRAIELKPHYADALYNLGNALRMQDRYAEAADAYRRCLRYNKRHAKAWYNLGNALKNLERFQEAIEAYGKAVRVKPDHLSAWINLGNTLTQLGRLDEAVVAYRKALELNPKYANTRYNFGRALRQQDKFDEALEQFRLASEYAPNDPRPKRAYESLRSQMERSDPD